MHQSFPNFPTSLVKSQQNEIRSSIGSISESPVTSQGLNVNPSSPYINIIEQQKMLLNHFTHFPRQLLNHETFQQLQQQRQQNAFTRPFLKHPNPQMAAAASVRMNSFRQELLRQKLAQSSQSNAANNGTKSATLPGPHFSFSPAEIQAQLKLRASSISSSSASSHDHSPSPPVENNFRHHPYFGSTPTHNFHPKPIKLASSSASAASKNNLAKPKFDFDLKIKKEFNESPSLSVSKTVQDNINLSSKNNGTIWSPLDLPDRKNFCNDKNEYKDAVKNYQLGEIETKNVTNYEEEKMNSKDETSTKVHSNENKIFDKSIENDSSTANETSKFAGIPLGLQSLIEEYQRGLRDQATANQVANQFQVLQQSLKTLISLQQQMNSTSAFNGKNSMHEYSTLSSNDKIQENGNKSVKKSSESDSEKMMSSTGKSNC